MTYNESYNQLLIAYLQGEGYKCDNSESDWVKLFHKPEVFGANWMAQVNIHIKQSTGVDYFINIARNVLNISLQPTITPAVKPTETYEMKAVESWEVVNGELVQSWELVEKTALEKWEYPKYSKRIVASELLLLDETGARFFKLFEVRGLPWKNNNGVLNIYCNEIEETYLSILSSFGESVTIENRPA